MYVSLAGRLQRQIKAMLVKPVKNMKTLRGGSLPDIVCMCVCVRPVSPSKMRTTSNFTVANMKLPAGARSNVTRVPLTRLTRDNFSRVTSLRKPPTAPTPPPPTPLPPTSQTHSPPSEPLRDLTSSF